MLNNYLQSGFFFSFIFFDTFSSNIEALAHLIVMLTCKSPSLFSAQTTHVFRYSWHSLHCNVISDKYYGLNNKLLHFIPLSKNSSPGHWDRCYIFVLNFFNRNSCNTEEQSIGSIYEAVQKVSLIMIIESHTVFFCCCIFSYDGFIFRYSQLPCPWKNL